MQGPRVTDFFVGWGFPCLSGIYIVMEILHESGFIYGYRIGIVHLYLHTIQILVLYGVPKRLEKIEIIRKTKL